MPRAWKRAFALALLPLVFSLSWTARAKEPVPGLDALLAEIPLSAFDGWLTYADLDVLAQGYDAALPGDTEAFILGQETPEGGAVMAAYLAVNAGPSAFFQYMVKSGEFLASSGFDFFHVRRALEVGAPPANQLWLAGMFDSQAIHRKLTQSGYLQVNTGFAGRETWAVDGDLSAGSKMDLNNRDPFFLFGGTLGQAWPVVQMPGIIASTRSEEGIRAIGFNEGPPLGGYAPLSDALGAIRALGGVAQLYALTPAAAGLDVAGVNAQPRCLLVVIAHVFTGSEQLAVLALAYADAADMKQAETALSSWLAGDVTLSTGATLMRLVADRGGEMEPLQSLAAPGGSHVLLIPFRFALPKPEGDGHDPFPYRLFVNMLLRRDLGWLETTAD